MRVDVAECREGCGSSLGLAIDHRLRLKPARLVAAAYIHRQDHDIVTACHRLLLNI